MLPPQHPHKQQQYQPSNPGAQTLWNQQQQSQTPVNRSNQNGLNYGVSMQMGGGANKNGWPNSVSNTPTNMGHQQQQALQQQSWQQRGHNATGQAYGQKQQQPYVQPPVNQQKTVKQSPNQRRQKNMQSAGKSIVYQDYRDSNAVSKHNGQKSGLKYGKPSGTPQGAVVISPAQLRAKSMKNSKHLKGRRKKSSPPIQGTRF